MVGVRKASRHGSHRRYGLLPGSLILLVLLSSLTGFAARSQELATSNPWVTTVIERTFADVRPLPPERTAAAAPSVEVVPPPSRSMVLTGPAVPQADASAGRTLEPSAVAFVPEFAGGLAENVRLSFEREMGIGLSLLAFVLATSLLRDCGAVVTAYAAAVRSRASRPAGGRASFRDESEARAARDECDRLLNVASDLWRQAEPIVLRLEEASALRNFLMKELGEVTKRLSMVASKPVRGDGAVMAGAPAEYWITLRQRLRRTVRDLERIRATADAALSTVGGKYDLPRVPETKTEALVILGANREIDHETLQRLVRALRQCWHPDLSRSDEDRRYRNARIAQINVAYDILSGRRAEG